jgi:hypothetical protein
VSSDSEGQLARPDLQRLAQRGAESLARFILTLANDDNGIGAYVRTFVAGDNIGETLNLLKAEIGQIRKGERAYDYRHRRNEVHLKRVDHLLDAIELMVLPADPRGAFELLTQLIEADGEVAGYVGGAWLQPTYERACELWLLAAESVPKTEVELVRGQLNSSDDYGLRGKLNSPGG